MKILLSRSSFALEAFCHWPHSRKVLLGRQYLANDSSVGSRLTGFHHGLGLRQGRCLSANQQLKSFELVVVSLVAPETRHKHPHRELFDQYFPSKQPRRAAHESIYAWQAALRCSIRDLMSSDGTNKFRIHCEPLIFNK
jgi:hypothetical protein